MVEAAAVALLGREPKEKDPFFYRQDLKVLRGILALAAHLASTDPKELMGLLRRRGDLARLVDAAPRDSPAVLDLEAITRLDTDLYNRAVSGAEGGAQRAGVEQLVSSVTRRERSAYFIAPRDAGPLHRRCEQRQLAARTSGRLAVFGVVHRHLNRRLRAGGGRARSCWLSMRRHRSADSSTWQR